MALDGLVLSCLKNEILQRAFGARVDKVYQPSKEEIILSLRGVGQEEKLLLSARSSAARVQFTKLNFENPPVPPMLCMLLRKCLVGARLTKVLQTDAERILTLVFDARNEFGDAVELHLICELMGRNSNLILTDEQNKIIDCIKRTDATSSVRILLPGVRYALPPVQDRLDVLSTPPHEIAQAVLSAQTPDLFTALTQTVAGISPVVCRQLIHNYEASCSSQDRPTCLAQQLELLLQKAKAPQPSLLIDENGKTDFSFFAADEPPIVSSRQYDSFSDLLDAFYGEREFKERMRQKSLSLTKTVNNILARVRRRLENQRQELKQTEQREHLRECGELIKANLHLIKTGDTACDVVNYYSENCEQIRIALDPALTPTQNAQKYFKEYRKANTAVVKLTERIEQGQQELAYLESVALELERAASDGDLNEIRNELISEGYLKRSNTKEKVRRIAAAPIEYRSSDGFKILVGRNNRQNDELTVHMASGRDYWFHTKHIPGAHVIVFAQGEEIPLRTVEEAARIAAAHSKAQDGAAVEVDYLPAKRVKKPNGAAAGMVVYENYQTAYVTVDQAGVQQLRVSQEGN